MRAVIQRVKHARLTVDDQLVSEIDSGLMVMLGVMRGDDMDKVHRIAKKIATIRLFRRDGKLNDSVLDLGYSVMLISNFTLCSSDNSGARPDFSPSADRETAYALYIKVAEELRALGVNTVLGRFGENMQIDCHLDGPGTIFKEI